MELIELYDLDADIGEQHPLPNTTAAWRTVVANITAARDAHLKSVVKVQDQLALGSDSKYALCGAPDSKTKYPQYPNCTMNPENWIAPWSSTTAVQHSVVALRKGVLGQSGAQAGGYHSRSDEHGRHDGLEQVTDKNNNLD